MALTSRLAELVPVAYQRVAPASDRARLNYKLSVPLEETRPDAAALKEALRQAMAASRKAELDRGVSLYGPHREDLDLELNGLPARGYASHGESWSYALALRLGAFELLRQDGEGDPILILDDVFAELDATRRSRLSEVVMAAEQTLITAAVGSDVPAELGGRRFRVEDGVVGRE
jgi:DNA replication and repair protein RecF